MARLQKPKGKPPGKPARMASHPIPASYKPKDRYIAFEVLSAEKGEPLNMLMEKDVSYSLNGAIISFIGQVGFAAAAPKLMEWDPHSAKGVLKCNLDSLESVRSALLFLSDVAGAQVFVNVTGVSGEVNKLL